MSPITSKVVKSRFPSSSITFQRGKGGGRTEPVAHVGGTTRVGKGLELGDEEVDVALDDGFLLEEGLLAKGVGEGAALAGVVDVVGHCEGC